MTKRSVIQHLRNGLLSKMVVSSMPSRAQRSHPERSLRRSRARWSTVRITEARCLKSERRTNHEHSVLWSDNPQWFVEEQSRLSAASRFVSITRCHCERGQRTGFGHRNAVCTSHLKSMCLTYSQLCPRFHSTPRLRSHHRSSRDGYRAIDASLRL